MLKHEDATQTSPSPAAKVRVTPEELAAAVTALQIRKEGSPGTIAIGDAVEELGLDVTPEEVLAEVQAKRQVAKPKRRRDYRALACAFACISVLVFSRAIPAPNRAGIPSEQPAQIQINPNMLQVKDDTGRQAYLSEVGNNHVFQCRMGGGHTTALDYQPNNLTVPEWTLIKHDDQFYVRGWMPRVSDKVLKTDGVFFSNDKNPQFPIAVTFPIRGFKVCYSTGDEDGQETLHATDIHLDSHAYEKW